MATSSWIILRCVIIILIVVVIPFELHRRITAVPSGPVKIVTERFPPVSTREGGVQSDLLKKKVFITGVAGFIGFHVAKSLAKDENVLIVGVDNFNDYYDEQLKIDRAFELNKLGVHIHFDDLCNEYVLSELFDENNFTHVIHLAAQAGVRYSLDHPLSYVRSNVQCFLTLLEVLKSRLKTKLVYASSSSVYGPNSSLPFQLSSSIDQPANLYAATKLLTEKYALHYCQSYGLRSIGLRFFTVYGPWGRPDMAVYKFTEAIMKNMELPFYVQKDRTPLHRDFTYIDDIVHGILSALDYVPSGCGECFNLGSGHPSSLTDLIELLENELSMKAKLNVVPMPATELVKTWADISVSTELLHFKPHVDLAKGVHQFITWYMSYTESKMQKVTQDPSEQHLWFERLCQERENHVQKYAIKGHTLKSGPMQKRNHFKEKKKAKPSKEKQCKHGSLDCKKTTKCFLNGQLCLPHYKKTKDQTMMTENPIQCYNFINVPTERTLDNMYFFQGYESPEGGFAIDTQAGYPSVKPWLTTCTDDLNCLGVTTTGVLKNHVLPFNFWRKTTDDITAGILVIDTDYCILSSVECPRNARCVRKEPGQYACTCPEKHNLGINECYKLPTLHKSILSQKMVIPEKDQMEKTGLHKMPAANVHIETAPAVKTGTTSINIVISVDSPLLHISITLINSILKNTRRKISFYIIYIGRGKIDQSTYISCLPETFSSLNITILSVNPNNYISGYIKKFMKKHKNRRLAVSGNLIRFYFHRILSNIDRAIYLDTDVIVESDIGELWDLSYGHNTTITVSRRLDRHYMSYGFRKQAAVIDNYMYNRTGKHFDINGMGFNAGVYVVNLKMWRRNAKHIEETFHFWAPIILEYKLSNLLTQPLQMLTFYHDLTEVGPEWNVLTERYKRTSGKRHIIHWAGGDKPWQHAKYSEHWTKYQVKICSGHGTCIGYNGPLSKSMEKGCHCTPPYKGKVCNSKM